MPTLVGEQVRRACFYFTLLLTTNATGRHPCIGMKLAILEMKLVLATVLLGFEWELVDRLGGHLKTIPAPARNNLHTVRIFFFNND